MVYPLLFRRFGRNWNIGDLHIYEPKWQFRKALFI